MQNVSLLSTGELKDILTRNEGELALTQHGCDLHLLAAVCVDAGGHIPQEGNTIIPQYSPMKVNKEVSERGILHFERGRAYSVMFEEGCQVPNNAMLLIRQRSSLLRIGGVITSSLFDAGFKTANIGTVMIAHADFSLEVGARIAQIYGHSSPEVAEADLYSGQYQEDKQRLVTGEVVIEPTLAPDEFRELSMDELSTMSDGERIAYSVRIDADKQALIDSVEKEKVEHIDAYNLINPVGEDIEENRRYYNRPDVVVEVPAKALEDALYQTPTEPVQETAVR